MLDSADGPFSLAASMSTSVELLEGWIDAMTANRVRWGSRSMLVAAVLHFPELKPELELLGSGHDADLTEDEVDALWTRVRVASDSLASYVPSLVSCSPPDCEGE
jgi:hypothetical protein